MDISEHKLPENIRQHKDFFHKADQRRGGWWVASGEGRVVGGGWWVASGGWRVVKGDIDRYCSFFSGNEIGEEQSTANGRGATGVARGID